jgi:diguanylate cyclase (GGDEF)-like protein/PAS domain S-box-containing protein
MRHGRRERLATFVQKIYIVSRKSEADTRITQRTRMTPDRELRVLMLEDVPAEAELCQRELQRAGLKFKALRVDTRAAFEQGLKEFEPDLILSDFSMPTAFDGLSALGLAREASADIPFIFVSGTIGEDRAVEAMKRGATDYVLKDRLARLPPVVARALKEARERGVRRNAEEEIQEREARIRLILDNALDAFITIDQIGAVIEWSRQAEAMFGWKREEILGRSLDETIVPERYRSAYKVRLLNFAQPGIEAAASRPVELPALHRNGSEFSIEAIITPFKKDGHYFFSAFVRDIRRGIKTQQHLQVQNALARVLAETATFEEVPSKLLQVTCESMGFTVGVLWEVDENADALRCVDIWHFASPALEQFAAKTREITSRSGTGIAGRVWKSGIPAWIPDATINPSSPRAPYAAQAGLHENLVFPITVQGAIAGVVDFFGPEAREPDPGLLEVFAAIGTQIGQFIERKKQQLKIVRLNRIYAVLSGINSAIMRIRDRQQLLEEACRIAVEHGNFGLAWIGSFDPVTLDVTPIASAGMGTTEMKQQKSSARTDISIGQGLVGNAIRERKPVFSNDIAATPTVGGKRRQETLRMGYRSLIVLPLYVEDTVAGVLSLFAKEPHFFTDEELELLTELASDISFALDYFGKREKLNYLAYYDALTSLPNRTLLHERLTQEIDDAQQNGNLVAVLLVDIRRFRLVNETLGRHAGDVLLRELAQRFKQQWPDPDHISRINADCFAGIIADAKDLSQIAYSVEKLLTSPLASSFTVDGKELTVAVTGGLAVFPADGLAAESLLQNAEVALKRAKASGEHYLFYRAEMNATVAEILLLEGKMRRALDKGQFVLHYQPKVELVSGKISSLEALIRWEDPESGLVPPAQFIPLLEETGMILEAGRWALHKALEDSRKWHTEEIPPLRVAVNVSAIQLRQKDFVDVVRDAVRNFPGGAHGLDLEITESLIMEDIEGNIEKLRAIRDLGVNIAIDDFGTGYSSLRYLAKLPVNSLKIDRSFIITMVKEPDSMNIVSTIISLAHSLKLKVIAEGVDAEEQSNLLKLLRCNEIQGYLISKPLPSHELTDFLREHRRL